MTMGGESPFGDFARTARAATPPRHPLEPGGFVDSIGDEPPAHVGDVESPRSGDAPKAKQAPPAEPPEMLLPFKGPEDLPRFPIESLPRPVKSFVLAVALELEVPVDLPAVLSFGALAAAVMGKYQVEASPGWIVPLNLYAVVALPSGELKSAAFKRVFRPLYDHQRALRVDWESEKRRIEADNASKAPGEPEEAVPPCPRLFADDVTPEALARLLADQGERITIASDEGTIFGMMCGLYSEKPNNGIFLKGHDGSTFIVDRKIGPSTYLESPLINLTLAVQPSIIQSLAEKPDMRGNGLWARWLYSFPIPRVGTKTLRTPSVSEADRLAYGDWLKDMAGRCPPDERESTVRLSHEAGELLIDAMVKVDRECAEGCSLASIADWASKLRGEVVRLAGLIHVAEHGQSAGSWISVETMARALDLGRYFLAHARHAFQQEMTRDSNEAASLMLWKIIERKSWSGFTQREVQHHVSSLRKGDAAASALKGLVERGYLRVEKSGRKSLYVVVPRPPPEAARPPPTTGQDETIPADTENTKC